MVLHFSADGNGKEDFQDICGQKQKHSCGQGREKAGFGDVCQPEDTDGIKAQCAEKEPQDLHKGCCMFLHELPADPDKKKITDQIPAGGRSKPADSRQKSGKNRKPRSTQQKVQRGGCQCLFRG